MENGGVNERGGGGIKERGEVKKRGHWRGLRRERKRG